MPFPLHPAPQLKPLVPPLNSFCGGYPAGPPSHSLPTLCPSHKDLSLPVLTPPTSLGREERGGIPLSTLQVVISISLSPTAISELFTETNRRQRDNIKIVSGWGGGGGTTGSWIFLSLLFKRESLIFSKALPNNSQTAHLGAPWGQAPSPRIPQFPGQSLPPAPKSMGLGKAHRG